MKPHSIFGTRSGDQEVSVGRFRKSFYVALGLALTTSCASTASRSSNDSRDDVRTSDAKGNAPFRSRTVANPDEIIINGMKLENTKFDYPITVNTRVEYWIDYFTGRGRKHFEKYLERSELFIPYIRPILKQNGLPEDLVYLAMIESGFNNHARSWAKAVGPWQFIPGTGKRYGLSINWWVDERRDTRKSTLSAAQYLKELYEMFQSWELAAAAYNAGEGKIARAIRRYGTNDFWSIARQRFLRPETRDYVPKIIAAALVSKNRTQFGFKPENVEVHKNEAIAPDGEVVKLESESAQPPSEAAREALESVLKGEDYENRPEIAGNEEVELAPATMNDSGRDTGYALAKPVPTPHVNKKGELTGEELLDFEVQSPADLLKISRAAGLSYHTVKSLNPELLRWCTPPNTASYRIKLPVSVKDRFLTAYNDPSFQKRVEFLTYKVNKGQSLQAIARHFGIKVDPIADLNGISPKATIRKGMLIQLPMPTDKTRSIATLEIRDPPAKKRTRYRKVNTRKKSVAKKATFSKVDSKKRAKIRRTASF